MGKRGGGVVMTLGGPRAHAQRIAGAEGCAERPVAQKACAVRPGVTT